MYIHHESNRRSSYVYQQKPVVWGPRPAGSIKLFGYPWLLFWELFGDIIGIILCIYINYMIYIYMSNISFRLNDFTTD